MKIPYAKQWIEERDIDEVDKALRSDWLTTGPYVKKFEEELANLCGARYAVAVANGTAALHCATIAAGIKAGDEGVTSAISFLASANCIAYCGGKPRFADIDDKYYTIDPQSLAEQITPRTRVLIPVHFAGQPVDLEAVHQLATQYNLLVIEDAAHAIGSTWRDSAGDVHKIGSCSYSDMTTFSFHPVKTITTGEGGAITTNDESLYKRLLLARNHGMTKDVGSFENDDLVTDAGEWYYEQEILGYNYRITDFQCALGLSQLQRLDEFISRRREIVKRYNEAFEDIPGLITPSERADVRSAWHLYIVRIDDARFGHSRLEVYNKLREKGILAQVHYIPIHLQPYYRRNFGYKPGDFPVAEKYYRQCLSLPLYPRMKDGEVERVIESMLY